MATPEWASSRSMICGKTSIGGTGAVPSHYLPLQRRLHKTNRTDSARSSNWRSPRQEIHLALVRPIFGLTDKTSAHRIFDHVVPFRGITFTAAQLCIPEMALPDW